MTIKIINHKKIEKENIKVPCKCGCGTLIWKFDIKSREKFYAKGHGIKININCWNKGKKGVYSEKTLNKMSKIKIGKCDNSKEENKLRKKARELSRNLSIKNNCEICKSTNKLEKHHWDYNKPLFVVTLCKECHEIQHIKHFENSKFARMEVLT